MEIPNTYLFTAYYEPLTEGSPPLQYDQSIQDKSLQEEGKNAFFDILFKPKLPIEKLYAFRLTEIDGDSTIAVNLRTGMFEINSYCFFQHDPEREHFTDFQLIYYRAIRIDRTVTYETTHGKELNHTDKATVGYILGWRAKGKNGHDNIERIIRI